ncbi:MAG: peptidoglycan DD-metalloendopeptidase family protein [Halioglobus sp.]
MLRCVLYSLLCVFLVACGGERYRAPVEDRRVQPKPAPARYSVQRGDTLFSIAWRYGLDFRAVAANNRIPSPYTIYPGQTIYLGQKAPAPAKKPVSSVPAKTATAKPVPPARTTSATVVKASSPPVSKPASPKVSTAAVTRWLWPTAGRITRSYSSTVHKGIDIDGKLGDPINAVAAGNVVYAGSGIVGYGELLIVKHNEVYLSAYGHNDRLLVSEGDQVRAGQRIATKGSSGTDKVKLHFEIRKEGKPIDPKRLLPSK